MDTNIFLHTMIIILIICFRTFGSVKCGDRTLVGRFSPKLEPIGLALKLHYTKCRVSVL